jgi:Flp pilus assembly protein TadD
LARALAAGQWSEALLAAQYIHTLRQDDMSFRLLGVCQLLSGQMESASATYQQHRTKTPPPAS